MDAKKTEAVSVKLPDSLEKYCDGIADFETVDSSDHE